jgi:LmbE family N-acetylglucosaminyl deacetylase
VLSPHLDDAVLSCPGYIQKLRQEGVKVVVATVFTEADAKRAAHYQVRQVEDRQAVRLLGGRTMHLGFRDAPFRSARYGNFCGIVFGRAHEYPLTLAAVTAELRDLIAIFQPERILAPLAIGNHVDHRVVRDAALAAVEDGLLFYEDRPYAFVRGARAGKLDPTYFAATYVRSYLGRTKRRTVVAKWARIRPFPYPLKRFASIQMDPAAFDTALRAIRTYATQIDDLFADEQELSSQYRSHPEILWSAKNR